MSQTGGGITLDHNPIDDCEVRDGRGTRIFLGTNRQCRHRVTEIRKTHPRYGVRCAMNRVCSWPR